MYLKRLALRHFRNYAEAAVDFAPGINVISGANAQGKTSLLEAIFLCVSGRSFRSQHLSELLKQDEAVFTVEAHFTKHNVDQTLRYAFDGQERRVLHNATTCHNTAQLLGIMPGVVHTPDDIALVKGSPQLRRQYLDIQIAQASPLYLHHLARYQRAMRQRNQLLRQRQSATFEAWEQEMASAAAYVVLQRVAAVSDLSIRACTLYNTLTDNAESLSLHYRTSAPIEEGLAALVSYYLDKYQQHRQREMELGWTSIGPHKDDLAITIQGKGSRAFASEGQQRSCVAAMRLAEWQRLKEQASLSPLLLVDDVAISLDQGRRHQLLDLLGTFGQVFLSSAYDLTGYLKQTPCHFLNVCQGSIREEGDRSQETGIFIEKCP